jgi:transketolase
MSDAEKSASTETGSMPLQNMANAIRALSMDAVQAANSGHPGLPMGAADIATVLYTKFLKIDPTALCCLPVTGQCCNMRCITSSVSPI